MAGFFKGVGAPTDASTPGSTSNPVPNPVSTSNNKNPYVNSYRPSPYETLRDEHYALKRKYVELRIASGIGYDVNNYDHRLRMLNMRMRVPEGSMLPFDHITVAKADDKVFIFLVKNGKPALLEDDEALFPSDQLITQLRLLA